MTLREIREQWERIWFSLGEERASETALDDLMRRVVEACIAVVPDTPHRRHETDYGQGYCDARDEILARLEALKEA